MNRRIELHELLVDLIGSTNVYFQPPESYKIKYPCIVYELSDEAEFFANDKKYFRRKAYDVTVIDKDPDTEIPDRVSDLENCAFQRHFTSDNLNHYVYKLYY